MPAKTRGNAGACLRSSTLERKAYLSSFFMPSFSDIYGTFRTGNRIDTFGRTAPCSILVRNADWHLEDTHVLDDVGRRQVAQLSGLIRQSPYMASCKPLGRAALGGGERVKG